MNDSLCDEVLKTLPPAEDLPRCGSAAYQRKKLESQGQGLALLSRLLDILQVQQYFPF
jgi:hypothetical protein